ncbi:hypothetical protein [Flavobacterium selenitireducens]|uniref:hypothetical protein n=1 Tax=Flavobacterium selenitireducens TaxID=2722704 RepID=UPI00168A73B4|nr:hypothetical protein [Flavobacterium selenitireducens]MBD3583495.1 hypothetical protein [Flavobacterium selenitireducens]
MKYTVQINAFEALDKIPNYWTNDDYRQLLALFDFPDAQGIKDDNLLEMLQMAITDFEPSDAASVVLQHKLSDHLAEGQMDQLSHDMLLDKISEEYPNISLHYDLYNINQLLHKAFNGLFPSTKATLLHFTIFGNEDGRDFSKADVLRLLQHGLSPANLIVRMFDEQLSADVDFPDAESIIWEMRNEGDVYTVLTSEYWLGRDDVVRGEFGGEV